MKGRRWQAVKSSLMLRLSLRLALGVMIVALVVVTMVVLRIQHEMKDLMEGELERSALILIHTEADDRTLQELRKYEDEHTLGTVFSIYDNKGRLLASSSDHPLPLIGDDDTIRYRGKPWLAHVLTGHDRTIVLAMPESIQLDMAREVLKKLVMPLLIALGLLLPWTLWGVWRGLRPLSAFAREVEGRNNDDLSAFITPVPTEAMPLQRALNRRQTEIAGRIERERRFIGDAAHELRTPLAGMLAALDLAERTPREDVRTRALGNVRRAGLNATRLVAQLLELARLDHAEHAALETVDLAVMARTLRDNWPGIEIIEQQPVAVLARASWLEQAVGNLIENARRYGGSEVVIRIELNGPTLQVIDNGPGVAPEVLPRLGERFFRPAGQKSSGSGIGLSIVRRMVELCGGSLRFVSPPGQGLTVSMTFRSATAFNADRQPS